MDRELSYHYVNPKEYIIHQATLADIEPTRRMQAESWRETYANETAGVSQAWVDDVTSSWLTPEAMEN